MTDLQLFRLEGGNVKELSKAVSKKEKRLQHIIEDNMLTLLGVRFLASEYQTGKTHRGRIDSLGLDENSCPVIIEYKRDCKENVINQGLFYLDWLLDHRAEFRWLVMEKFGKKLADQIEWSGTRLLCIAADFTRYDQYAVHQIPRNIELLRYMFFDHDLLLLELVNTQTVTDITAIPGRESQTVPESFPAKKNTRDKSLKEVLALGSDELRGLYDDTAAYLAGLGDDIQEKSLRLYTAFRRLKNFACIVVQKNRLVVTLTLDPRSVPLEEGFTRDVTHIGHWGTGNVEVVIQTPHDLERAKPLLERSYTEGASASIEGER